MAYNVLLLAEVSVKVLVKVLAIISLKNIVGSISNTFLIKYRYWYWQYFLKVLLTTLYIHYNMSTGELELHDVDDVHDVDRAGC